jgi:hypothetical protein
VKILRLRKVGHSSAKTIIDNRPSSDPGIFQLSEKLISMSIDQAVYKHPGAIREGRACEKSIICNRGALDPACPAWPPRTLGKRAGIFTLLWTADSDPSRTVIPTDRGQRSGDCGQFLMSV